MLYGPPLQFHLIVSLLYSSKSPHNNSGMGNSSSTQAVALNVTPDPLPILTAILAVVSEEHFRQRLEGRFDSEEWEMGLTRKSEQKQNLALRMLMDSEAEQSKALSLHSSKLQRGQMCMRGLEREPAQKDPVSGCDLLSQAVMVGRGIAKAPLACKEVPPLRRLAKYINILTDYLGLCLKQPSYSALTCRHTSG